MLGFAEQLEFLSTLTADARQDSGAADAESALVDAARAATEEGQAWDAAKAEGDLLDGTVGELETKAFLAGRGIDIGGEQQTKTRTALEFFASQMK